MNQLVAANNVLLMSSKEIALIVEKRHDNVKRTIDSLYQKSIISCPQIEDGEKSANAGRFTIITGVNGENAYTTAKFTPKGVTWIAGEWGKHCVQALP